MLNCFDINWLIRVVMILCNKSIFMLIFWYSYLCSNRYTKHNGFDMVKVNNKTLSWKTMLNWRRWLDPIVLLFLHFSINPWELRSEFFLSSRQSQTNAVPVTIFIQNITEKHKIRFLILYTTIVACYYSYNWQNLIYLERKIKKTFCFHKSWI